MRETYTALYHDEESEQEKECALRQLIEGVMSSFQPEPGGSLCPNQLVPIPHTTDFLAVYQNNTEITFTFKHFGSLTPLDWELAREADLHLGALLIVEGRWKDSLAKLVTEAPEDQTIPAGDFPGFEGLLTKFREQVRELVDQEVAKHRDGS
jgi:hypothetical protein